MGQYHHSHSWEATCISIAAATFAIYLSMIAAIRDEKATIQPNEEITKQQTEVYEITAYTVGDDFTPSHGITASGKQVAKGDAACPPHMPFGTRIYIPALDRTVECVDRGGRIKGKRIDIYMTSRSKALKFGRQRLEVEIIK